MAIFWLSRSLFICLLVLILPTPPVAVLPQIGEKSFLTIIMLVENGIL